MKKAIICVDNIFNLSYYYWNLFYYFFFWGKHIYKMFFSLMISLTFTSFIRSLIYLVVITDQWRAEIGSFNCNRLHLSKFKWNNNQMFLNIVFIYFLLMCKVLNTKFCLSKLATRLMLHWKAFFVLALLFTCSLLLLHGDIELNPGPRNSKNHLPSLCHWNLNSLPAHYFSKMLLLKAYNAI